ncbi:MAG: BrnT family toxin [Acidihalobacter sp.]|uniref:BrnT family toxin n=1 Tax=Acidihalobacter sp. TaxID=1872108 RepID=UPI00307E0D70
MHTIIHHEDQLRPRQKHLEYRKTRGVPGARRLAIWTWDTLASTPDRRKDYGEGRMIGYALKADRLYCVVFTDRGNTRQIISLRKANSREVEKYAQID